MAKRMVTVVLEDEDWCFIASGLKDLADNLDKMASSPNPHLESEDRADYRAMAIRDRVLAAMLELRIAAGDLEPTEEK